MIRTDFDRMVDEAYSSGFEARRAHAGLDDNPFSAVDNRDQYDAWRDGWHDCDNWNEDDDDDR